MIILTLTDQQTDLVTQALEMVATNQLYTVEFCESVDQVNQDIRKQALYEKPALVKVSNNG